MIMASAITIVKSATEAVLGIGEVSIDNFTFKLFYKWSVSFFITGSVAAAATQFFGDPIACETVSGNLFTVCKYTSFGIDNVHPYLTIKKIYMVYNFFSFALCFGLFMTVFS